MDLLKPRLKPSFGRLEGIVLALYAILTGLVAHFHEPWGDEVQAWLIARDSSFTELFLKRLHYEGTPGLWHLWLWILCRFHVSYTGMQWVTVLTSIAAIYVLLRYSPFPPLVRALFPFCFSFVFLTAIIARSYSLAPLLTFAACSVLTGKKERPIAFAVLAGLLANTSPFGFMLAVGLVPVYLLHRGQALLPARREMMAAASIVIVLMGFAAYTALPAPDVTFGVGQKLASKPKVAHLLSVVTGIPQASAEQNASQSLPSSPDGDLNLVFLAKHANHPFLSRTLVRVISISSPAFFAVSSSNIIAFVFYGTLVWWTMARRSLSALLPLTLILFFGHIMGLSEHHLSMVTCALVVPLWVGWSNPNPVSQRLELLFQIILLATLTEQVLWTAHAATFDVRGSFDPGISTARFLAPKAGKDRIANIANIDSVSVLPYAPPNLFYNQSTSYYPWEKGKDFDESLPRILAQHPDIIVDANAFTGDSIARDQIWDQIPHNFPTNLQHKDVYLREHGYRETHRFCGYQPAHFGFYRETCDYIYEPVTQPQ